MTQQAVAHALIVSAQPAERRRLVAWLEGRDVTTWTCADLARGVAECRRQKPDVMFVDVGLARGGVLDLLARLPGYKKTSIVLIAEDPSIRQLVEQAGGRKVMCLMRPIAEADLNRILRSVLHLIVPGPAKRVRKIKDRFEFLIGNSDAMRSIYNMIAKVGPTDATVLICGESGTGKELVAQSIHQRSDRKTQPFLAVNCGSIPENLIESELFGHERGAFTGADRMRRGVFERAKGGTLFLDEIAEMPMEMQVRLLRVLEEHKVTRVGGEKQIDIDVRVIAATNRDTAAAVEDGTFREDLLYRIAVFPLNLPPLRERDDDVILLANHTLSELNTKHEKDKHLSSLGEERLREYHWPGNVRQLRNLVHRSFILEDDTIDLEPLAGLLEQNSVAPESCGAAPNDGASCPPEPPSKKAQKPGKKTDVVTRDNDEADERVIEVEVGTPLSDAERELILSTLEHCEGNKKDAAQKLGISLKTLYNRLKEYGQPDASD